jgi:glycerophosphoryl diester phosphodiesterase
MNLLGNPAAHPVIGHRGMAAAAPENTLEAMQLAFSYGADAVEFDLRLSANGEVMVIHDPTVDRTTDGTGPVDAKSSAELLELNAAARFIPGVVEDRPSPPMRDSFGAAYPEYTEGYARIPRSSRIPFFREVLEMFPEKHLLIEIKDPRASAGARKLIEQFGAEGRCMVDSDHDAALAVFRGSRIAVGAGKAGVAALLKSFFLLRKPDIDYDGRCIPTEFRGVPLPVGMLSRIARKDGKTVHIWTINSPEQARKLWKVGVNGIVTDDVRSIISARQAA